MELFGDKTLAWFDVWSIEHLVAGISSYTIGCFIIDKSTETKESVDSVTYNRLVFVALLTLAYGWETIEHYLEDGATNIKAVTYWFQGVEFWGNRIIADPALVMLGGFIAMRKPVFIKPARVFSLAWIVVHVFVFPHSMYLHSLT